MMVKFIKEVYVVEIYTKLIISKRKKIEQVPLKFKDSVESKLREYGYDIQGNLLEEG